MSVDINSRFAHLMAKVTEIDEEIEKLRCEKEQAQKEMLEIRIAPYKVGDYVMCELTSGRSRKWQKCLIEIENGCLYLRPIKNDGELSNRHFSFAPVPPKTFFDYFKEVK